MAYKHVHVADVEPLSIQCRKLFRGAHGAHVKLLMVLDVFFEDNDVVVQSLSAGALARLVWARVLTLTHTALVACAMEAAAHAMAPRRSEVEEAAAILTRIPLRQ